MSLGTDCSQSHRVCNVGLGTTQASGLSDRPQYPELQQKTSPKMDSIVTERVKVVCLAVFCLQLHFTDLLTLPESRDLFFCNT